MMPGILCKPTHLSESESTYLLALFWQGLRMAYQDAQSSAGDLKTGEVDRIVSCGGQVKRHVVFYNNPNAPK